MRIAAVAVIAVLIALGAGGGVTRSDPPDIAEIICHPNGEGDSDRTRARARAMPELPRG